METIRRREALSAELPLLPAVRAARMGTSPNLQFDSPFQRKSGYIFLCVLKGNLDEFFFVFQWESGYLFLCVSMGIWIDFSLRFTGNFLCVLVEIWMYIFIVFQQLKMALRHVVTGGTANFEQALVEAFHILNQVRNMICCLPSFLPSSLPPSIYSSLLFTLLPFRHPSLLFSIPSFPTFFIICDRISDRMSMILPVYCGL